jgi:hypothetical protein
MNKIDISIMPIEIVAIKQQDGHEWVDLNIGNIPTRIIDPDPRWFGDGVVSLFSKDIQKYNWEQLISIVRYNQCLDGFTDDPRLIKITEMILTDRITELQPGTIISPLSE